jgi:hypothetical protein
MDENRRLIPLATLAAVLGIRPEDLRRAADEGVVPCVRIGERGRLFDREVVERVLLERAAGDPSAFAARPASREDCDGQAS